MVAPVGVTATKGVYDDKVEDTWNPVPGAEEYKVYRSDQAASWIYERGGWQAGTVYVDTPNARGYQHYYSVVARNAYGETGVEDVMIELTVRGGSL